MSALADHVTAADYPNPKIVPEFTYDGATIIWVDTSPDDQAAFVEAIQRYAEALKGTYRVRSDTDVNDDLRLRLDFRGASSATDRQIMKGIVLMIIGDTIWGGGSR